MPDFEVIEGGGKRRGPRDFEADMARSRMNTLIIELLRAVARGDDHENRVGRTLIELFKHMSATDAPVYDMTSGPIADAHKSVSEDRDLDRYQTEIADIVLASLRVAAESCTSDGFSDRSEIPGRNKVAPGS
jgi:phytoene/squalene synthetase